MHTHFLTSLANYFCYCFEFLFCKALPIAYNSEDQITVGCSLAKLSQFNWNIAVADPGGFQDFHGNPLLKFIYSNRAVRLRLSNRVVGLKCSNYSSFIRNHPVINVKYCRQRSMKVDDLFFWPSTQTELAFLSSWNWNPLSKILDLPLYRW